MIESRVLGRFFFFSSRRRHTRCGRDWSSDVCSSDLIQRGLGLIPGVANDCDATAEDATAGQRRIRDRKLNSGPHAWHLADRIEVVALHVSAINRAGLHGRPFHAWKADVDTVNDSAGDLVRYVEVFPL